MHIPLHPRAPPLLRAPPRPALCPCAPLLLRAVPCPGAPLCPCTPRSPPSTPGPTSHQRSERVPAFCGVIFHLNRLLSPDPKGLQIQAWPNLVQVTWLSHANSTAPIFRRKRSLPYRSRAAPVHPPWAGRSTQGRKGCGPGQDAARDAALHHSPALPSVVSEIRNFLTQGEASPKASDPLLHFLPENPHLASGAHSGAALVVEHPVEEVWDPDARSRVLFALNIRHTKKSKQRLFIDFNENNMLL